MHQLILVVSVTVAYSPFQCYVHSGHLLTFIFRRRLSTCYVSYATRPIVCKSHIANMVELPVVSDAEFRTGMQVFGLPIDEKSEENGREVVLFTKTANVTLLLM